MIQGRADIYTASRIVIKAGTSVVSTPDGYPSLSRIANIVENAAQLAKEGKQVMIVTSGTEQCCAIITQPVLIILNFRCRWCGKAAVVATGNHASHSIRPAFQKGVSD